MSHPPVIVGFLAEQTSDPMRPNPNVKETHMAYDYTTLTSDPDGYLNWVLSQLGAALSVRTETVSEADWIQDVTAIVATFPDPMIRARLASTCTLRQLRHLVGDPHLAVRLACVDNPFAIDRDIQIALCNDTDTDVIHALIKHVPLCVEAYDTLLTHPSAAIRARIASPRRRRRILDRLTHDVDPAVRQRAEDARRHQDRVHQHNTTTATAYRP